METLTLRPTDVDSLVSPDFWDLPHPIPEKLTLRGHRSAFNLLRTLPRNGLAVVGTRDPQPRSLEETRRVIRRLQGSGIVILSGLARGIDAEAHEAALEAGLKTIAVLGGGVEEVFPASNRGLARKIIDRGGLLISEYGDREPAYPARFLERNRLIAGLSAATWVVEAAHRSGSLNTASWARKHGRSCYATPCLPGDVKRAGNQTLIDEHQAYPLWGPHGFASTHEASWLHLAALCPSEAAPKGLARDAETRVDVLRLTAIVTEFFDEGIDEQSLFDRQLSDGWVHERFFKAVDFAVRSGALLRRSGLLLKNASHPL